MVLTINAAFAGEVEAMLLRDFEQSYEVERSEYRDAPVLRRILMHVARLFSPIL